MSGWKSYEEIKEDYVRQAEKKNPEKGQEIGEIFFFLSSKLLFMKHRLSEYKKMATLTSPADRAGKQLREQTQYKQGQVVDQNP